MTNGKTNLKERKVSLLFFLFSVVIFVVIMFLIASYLVSSKIMDALAVIADVCFIFMIYFGREDISVNWDLFFTFGGIYIGTFFNISLSTEFLSEPSIVFLVINSFITCILLWASFALLKNNISWHKKLAFVFLGCWIASLFLALLSFIGILAPWLSLHPLEEVTGGFIRIPSSVTVNILKSLFLSSLFNVLERITRISGR